MAVKQLFVLDHSGYENYQTDVYLYGLYYMLDLNILMSPTTCMIIPQFMKILYNTSLPTESLAFLKSMNSYVLPHCRARIA
jgi:hypothetical protein